MKRNLLGMCLVALLACAGTASADVLAEDSAANYTAESFVNGANLGTGFGNWVFWNAWPTLADSTAGLCGDVNSENGLSFRFARDGGADYCNGYRGFNALKVGDVLSFKFTCAYCGGGRGLDLFANGGHEESDKIANVIHLSGDNEFSVNGTVISTEWATNAVTEVTVVQEADDILIAVARTTPDESGAGNVTYWTKVETDKKLTGIGIYAGGWDWNDGADVENYAFYVNDLKIEGEPPTDTLTLSGPWDVTEKETELPFKVTRQNSEGTLDVALVSSYPEFASVPNLVTIADGDTEAPFKVTVSLKGRGNVATISASAEGVTGASFEVKGPDYRVNNGSDSPVSFLAGESADIWINWDGGARDDSKLALTAEPEDVISVPADWTLPAEGDVYVQSSVTALAPGDAALVLSYDGVEMARCGFSVLSLGLELSGPPTAKTGDTKTYTVKATLDGQEDGCTVAVSPEGAATVDPDSFSLVEAAEDGFFYRDISVTFNQPGDVTLSLSSLNYPDPVSVKVTVSDPADYSDFIAYDDASLYGDSLDYAAVGAGTDKFQAWEEITANSGGAFISGSAPDASVLTDDKAFGIWANGADDAELQLRRPFVNSLGDGQAFSVVVSPNYRDGTKGVKFMGYDAEVTHEWWQRAEFFYNNDGYFYKLEGDEDATSLGWNYGTGAITITLKKAADGSGYTLTFARGEEIVAKEGITSFGGTIDAAQFYSYQGGQGDENNFVFNKLAIEQVEDPIEPPPPAVTMSWTAGVWNPDEVGVPYTFELAPSEIGAIALVDLSIEPAEGVELSADQIDLSEGAAGFTLTFTGETLPAGTAYTITAKAQAEGIDDASYNLTATEPASEISPTYGTYDYVLGGTVEFQIVGTPSRVGVTVDLDSDNEGILLPPESRTAVVGAYGSEDGKFSYTMPGLDDGETYIHARYEGAEWGYAGITINGKAGDDPNAKALPIIAQPSISGKSMTLTVDGTPAAVYGATEIVESNWAWQPIEGATIDGDKVTVDMTGIPYLIIKVEK